MKGFDRLLWNKFLQVSSNQTSISVGRNVMDVLDQVWTKLTAINGDIFVVVAVVGANVSVRTAENVEIGSATLDIIKPDRSRQISNLVAEQI